MASGPTNQTSDQTSQAKGSNPLSLARILPIFVPTALLLAAVILPANMFQSDQTASKIGLGPAAWPDAMLEGMAFFSFLWIARDLWVLGDVRRKLTLSLPIEDTHYNFGKAISGLGLIICYGWLLPILGFALATALFIAIWCLSAGLRNLLVVIPVSLIGTTALMWLFMGLALMPLPRGSGAFDNLSIWLLRATGIY